MTKKSKHASRGHVKKHEVKHNEKKRHLISDDIEAQKDKPKQDTQTIIWIATAIGMTILFLIFAFVKNPSPGTELNIPGEQMTDKDEIFFLYSTNCKDKCVEMEPIAREYAEIGNLGFRKVEFPQAGSVPLYFVIKDKEMTILPETNTAEEFTVQMCQATDNSEICNKADEAKAAIAQAAKEAEEAAMAGIPKKDKPVVELFVMSHCPYGTQIEKGFIPVVDTLKDSIDYEVKFVYYAMHGQKELDEQLNQYCIQKEQNDKFLPYLKCFLGENDAGAKCLAETKVDTTKLDACVAKTDADFKVTEQFEDKSTWQGGRFPLFDVYKADNQKYGVGGSPTFVLNGKEVRTARDSASLLKTICSGFTNQPAACNTELSSASPSPGFGYATSGAAASATCG